jgi:hypothetical protein
MTAQAAKPEKPASASKSVSLKPMGYVVPVFVVMASLTMHATNGFLHAIFGGGPESPLRGLDTVNGVLMSLVGPAPVTFVYGALTGVLSGLTYWVAARKQKSIIEQVAAEPDKRRAPKRRVALKPRQPEQVIVDPSRVAKVMGLRASSGSGSFEA